MTNIVTCPKCKKPLKYLVKYDIFCADECGFEVYSNNKVYENYMGEVSYYSSEYICPHPECRAVLTLCKEEAIKILKGEIVVSPLVSDRVSKIMNKAGKLP
jgi:uncharacterized protein YbaR (Trm112 family)